MYVQQEWCPQITMECIYKRTYGSKTVLPPISANKNGALLSAILPGALLSAILP